MNNSFNETFIKPSTQYLQKRNKLTANASKGIDINDYFAKQTDSNHRSKKPLTYQERMELNQKRALEKLKKSGNVNIGPNASKPSKFSIKRKKIMNKRVINGLDHHANVNKMDVDSSNKNESLNNDLNESSNISSNNTLNSTMSSLGNCGDESMRQSENDKISENVQRFELARKAAEDQTNAFDENEHLENCNVYVGGLHPDVDQAKLRKLFKHCGDIKSIRLDWRNKGFGFVHYATHEQARECIEDMDGRLIYGQQIKCRWAQNKKKERERALERELAERNGTIVDPADPNAVKLNGVDLNVLDDINTNHPQPAHQQKGVGFGMGNTANYYGNANSNNKKKGNDAGMNDGSASSIGFLSRSTGRKSNKSSPPALDKVNNENKNNVEDTDGVEYW